MPESTYLQSPPPWGTYAPRLREQRLILSLVRAGLSRGSLRHGLQKRWIRKFGSVVDVERRGVRYRLDLSNNVTDSKILLSSAFYDQVEIEAICAGSRGVFVDVGANIGYYGLMCAAAGFSKVLAIEANPAVIPRLTFNVQANPWHAAVTIVPTCVGDGSQVPFCFAGDFGSARISTHASPANTPPMMLDSKPLAKMLAENGIPEIDAMKIDIEGYEDRALMPFFAQTPKTLWPRVLVIETCHRQEWQQDVIAHMLQSGYRVSGETRANLILKK